MPACKKYDSLLCKAMPQNNLRIAVLLPCHNEEKAIARVVEDFRAALPNAHIYVYDNASSDATYAVAKAAGAIVRNEPRKGKGNVVRRMFADIDADLYIMADGDGTYDAAAAPEMVEKLLSENLDGVIGIRKEEEQAAYRRGHRFGNRFLNWMVQTIFSQKYTLDMLSGFRVYTRRFVKTFPAVSHGFEIETELTIHALQLRIAEAYFETKYSKRAQGSHSKLSTYRDGFRILKFIIFLFKEGRPLIFFGMVGLFLILLSLTAGIPVILDYLDTGLVRRFPTAFLSMGLMLSAFLSIVCGVILESLANARTENKRLHYLDYAGERL